MTRGLQFAGVTEKLNGVTNGGRRKLNGVTDGAPEKVGGTTLLAI